MPVRKAEAVWEGTLKDGRGMIRLGSGAFEGAYSFGTRFEDKKGTNPEELLGAAHAGCFAMAFSKGLAEAGYHPEHIEASAKIHLEKQDAGFAITRSEVLTEARVPDIEDAEFQQLAKHAVDNCLVSKVLTGTKIDVKAVLKR
jgi:osmotically inducible protein OsmC